MRGFLCGNRFCSVDSTPALIAPAGAGEVNVGAGECKGYRTCMVIGLREKEAVELKDLMMN